MPHPFGDDVELRRRILIFLGDRALPRILRLTMPLFVPDGRGLPQLVASSVIVQVGHARLLLTATHVVNRWRGLVINIGDEFLDVRGHHSTIYSTGAAPGSDDDKLDVSIIRLETELAERILPANIAALEDLDLTTPAIGRDPFVLSGYPERRNRAGLSGSHFSARAYALVMYDGEESLYDAVRADSTSQLVLPFERNDVWAIHGQVTAPDLEGVSGGGLWRVPIRDTPLHDTGLSAIAVEQHPRGRNRHVLATRVRTVLATIHNIYADLREALESEYHDLDSH